MISSAGKSSNRRPVVDADFIFSRVSEVELLQHYLGIPVQYTQFVSSPLRTDNDPSCKFQDRGTYILFRDFTGHFSGDCFRVVQFMYGLDWKEAYVKIAEDFGLIASNTVVTKERPLLVNSQIKRKPKVSKAKIEVKRREWIRVDTLFWTSFGITLATLRLYNVSPCQVVWLNGKWSYTHNDSNPGYVYDFNNEEYKIYFPLTKDKKFKFWSNCNVLQGVNQLDHSKELCIVTKSLKDVMVLHELGYNAVAPHAEGAFIDPQWMEYLCLTFNKVVIFYDNDNTGMIWAKKNSSEYGVPYIYLKGEEKDISDYRKANREEATKLIIKTILKEEYYVTSN